MNSCRFAFGLVVLSICCAALAQTPVLLNQPNPQLVANGTVQAMARAPDGSVFVGGHFSSIAGIPRSNIAKLLPDGTLDPIWNPGADDQVQALAVDAEGAVYAGGQFIHAGGLERPYVAKFDENGSGAVDASWDARSTSPIYAIGVDSGGVVFVGGTFFVAAPGFATIGGQPRNYIAKLLGNGDADPDWNPNPFAPVEGMAIDANGSIYIRSGTFGSFLIGGLARPVGKISTGGTGQIDTNWDPAGLASVQSIVLDGQGHIYLAGSSFNGQNIRRVMVDDTGADDPSWNPGCADSNSCYPTALALDQSGGVYVAGNFFNSIGGAPRANIARLDASGAADPSWVSEVDHYVLALTAGLDSKLYVGGAITSAGEVPRFGLAVLSETGGALPAVDAEANGVISAFSVQADGSVIVGGTFKRSGLLVRHNLLRIQANGVVDPVWKPDPDGAVRSIAIGENSNVFVCGDFTHIGGQPRARLAKIAGTGSGLADPGWIVDLTSGVALVLEFDATSGAVFVGGSFNSIDGRLINNLAKIGSDGTVDSSWDPMLAGNARIGSLVRNDAGSIYVGGSFASIGGQARTNLARLTTGGAGEADSVWAPVVGQVNSVAIGPSGQIYVGTLGNVFRYSSTGAGARDTSWNPDINFSANALAFDSQEQTVYAGGYFVVLGSPAQHNLVKASLIGAGTVDADWQPDANGGVSALATEADHRLLVGGSFNEMNAQARAGFAAFGPDRVFANSFE